MGLTAAERMRRYRSRKNFKRAVQWCLDNGVPQEELQDLVGFVGSKGQVTPVTPFRVTGQVTPVTPFPVTRFHDDVKPMDMIDALSEKEKTPTIEAGASQNRSL